MNMGRCVIAGFALLFLLSEIVQLGLCGRCIESEKQALLKFKASFLGDHRKRLSSWNSKTNCCWWDGIVCHNVTGHVLKLDLSDRFLEASGVDPSLLELQHLIYLDLSGNSFNATSIPVFLGFVERLRYLSLSNSAFTGKIPTNLGGNLTDLRFLDLSRNDLHTNDMNWLLKLQSLQQLNLSDVYLGEAHNLFQVIHMLPSLLELQLEACGLVNLSVPLPLMNSTNNSRVHVLNLALNDIDDRILNAFQNWTSLEDLDLSFNKFGSMPSWLGEFQNMVSLDLSSNALVGPIPIVLRNLTSLKDLDLSSNNFRSIPSWLGELRNLRHLDISNNQIAATMEISVSQILKNMCHLKELNLEFSNLYGEAFNDSDLFGCIKHDIEDLFLSYNELSGHLPTWVGHLENLVDLDLSSNSFSGNISHLGQLKNLRTLDLSDNYFSGNVLKSFSQISKLVDLDLSSNSFNGNISHNLGQLVSLSTLDLSNNSFRGNIPQSLGQLSNLVSLDLSSNSFSGNIPQSFGQLSNLYGLDLSSNSFSGNVPRSFGQLSNLHSLNLSSNSFSGNIPQCFGQLSNLEDLDLSSNSFSGNISRNLSQLVNLKTLDLSNNSFRGNIPRSLGQLSNLGSLLLSRNNLHGTIPRCLCQIRSLSDLDLSHNNFSGEIPNCWRDNPPFGLMGINFSFNKLSGAFPISISKISSLFWLHLNNNHLEGKLPLTLKNSKLRILDLGENKFFGSIPPWTDINLPTLQILRLCNNMLDGSIPSKLCQLGSLQILDLANNNLNGSIPNCIGNLTGMIMAKDGVGIGNLTGMIMTKDGVGILYNRDPRNRDMRDLYKNGWPHQDVKQVMKGREFDYSRILYLVVNLDLSNNDLAGLIPLELFSLAGLIGLNLSHNHLKGEIPEIIENMKHLESFDISCNQISGTIPKSMPMLTALNYLNMSYNNLSGPIPTQNQFLTLNDPSIYAANPYLCGIPLPNKCQGDDAAHQVPETKELEDKKDPKKVWFYFVIAIGFVGGFWCAIGTLVVKKSWRHAYFRRAEDVADGIYVFTLIKMAKLKRLITNHVPG